jgi:hypothetical protein
MDDKKEKVFAKGFFFERPHQNAPDFVRGKMSIKVSEAVEWLEANKSERGYVNLDLLLAKDGEKLYFVKNEWVPKEQPNDGIIDGIQEPF